MHQRTDQHLIRLVGDRDKEVLERVPRGREYVSTTSLITTACLRGDFILLQKPVPRDLGSSTTSISLKMLN